MSTTMRYDAAPARRIMALSDTAEMQDQRRRVIELLAPEPGMQILDVGCGPGHLAAELAEAVGPTGQVVGVDVSKDMLALAERTGVELVHLQGTNMPFKDGGFDAAVATQVYEFVEPLTDALDELFRVLRPGARIVILDTDWDSLVWHSSNARRMGRVVERWCRRVAHPRLPRVLAARLRETGFEVTSQSTFAIFDAHGHPESYSSLQIEHLGASAAGIAPEEIEAWAADLRELASRGEYFFSLNRYLARAEKPSQLSGRQSPKGSSLRGTR
jgi:arsenite methyltransferase